MNVDLAPSTRPFAYADPRSLSQAWYDALYGSHAKPVARQSSASVQPAAAVTTFENARASSTQRLAEPQPAVALPAGARSAPLRETGSGTAEPPFEDPRTKVRAANAPRSPSEAARTDVELEDPAGGTVRLLVAEHGGGLEVIAVCEREARERTADALARARIALAARGVSLQTAIRERGTA